MQTFGVWKPRISFPDATHFEEYDWYLRLHSGGSLRWLRHSIVELVQSSFDYKEYPDDIQTATMRFFCLSMTDSQVIFSPPNDGSTGLNLFTDPYGEDSINLNPIWTYKNATISYESRVFHPSFAPRSTGGFNF